MGFSLRDKFNEATAQLNVFDGGKSAVTVRNNRQAQAAQTLRKKQEDEATMKMLQQKASQRNFQKLQSGQIDRPTYENQMGVIARNGNDPLVAPKLSLPQQAGKVVGTLNTGFQRSIAGLGESLGGAYDLVTPGTGVNRFTKNFTTAGQLKDIEAKQNGYNQALYKAGQLGGEAVQMFATGGVANALSKAPKVAAVTTKLASRVPAITGAGKLATAGRFITRPDVASNIATNVIQGSGFRTARGIDNNVGNVALDIGVTTALAGGLPIAGKAIQSGYRKLAPVAQQAGLKAQQFTNFTDNMVNTLSDFADYKRGDYTPDAQTLNTLIRQARAVARAGGIDITSGSPVDINNRIADWIEQTNAKKFKDGFVQIGGGKDAPQVGKTDQLIKQRRQLINDMEASSQALTDATLKHRGNMGIVPKEIMDSPEIKSLQQDFYAKKAQLEQFNKANKSNKELQKGIRDELVERRNSKLKPTPEPQSIKTEAPTVPDKYLKEYANMLRSFDDEASGGQMIPTADGGYKRISEHSPFYRDFFAEKRRKPSGKDYLEYAKNNIENDKDFMGYVAQKVEEDKLPKPISNKPSGRMSVAEKESLFSQVPQGTDKQIKISKPSGTKNIKVNKLVANEDLPLYETKKVGTADKIFRSTRSIIERQGESGKQLAGLLQKSRDTEELFQADVLNRLKTVRSLKGKEYENFVDATQGLAKPESAKVQQAIKEWKAVHPEMRQRAVNAGLDVGDLGETYYPHFVDYEKVFKDKNTYNQALNHLVKTGQAKNVEDAIQLLGYARDVSRNRKFGNLEASRLVDIPFYDKTKNSLVSYIQGTSKRIAQTETFGAKDEVALKYIADAGKQGYDTEAMKNAYDVAVGAKQYNPNTKAFSNKMRQYNSTTRLGQGALTNMTQNANTGIVTGHLRTMGAMLKQLDPKTRKFVESTGTISDGVINDLREGAGFTGKVLAKITAPGFSQVEKFNRSVAATAGRDYAQSLARKGDVATLQKLGITGKIGKELTEAQQIQAARKIVEKTQFKVDPQDLPGWVDSPGGKLVAQFRTFSYNQSKFFSNEILKPASKGNLMPLARLLAVIPAGYAMAEVKRVLNNRPEEDNKARKGIEAFGNVGGAGLAVDMFRSMVPLNNKYLPADRRVSMAVGTFGGPTAGAAAELVGAVSEVAQRKNVPDKGLESNKVALANNGESYSDATQLARLGLRQIPIVGTRLQNTLVPYKSNETKLSEQVKKEKDSATGLTKLSDGKYVAVINGEKKTFDNEQKAQKAISINDFMNSNDKTKEIDGKIYYKNDNTESGYSVKNKAEWDYDKSVNGLDLAIDKAKASNDLNGWMDAANKKYQALIKKRDSYDPETEFDKIDTVNKQLLNLEQEASKYSSNGYIKKPKTTSKKDSKSGNFNYKFFGFGSDPISTTKSLRQLLKEATLS